MDSSAELARKLENLVRPGAVSAVNGAQRRCRVKSGDLETDWLPWITLRAGSDRTWWPPSVDEQCLLISPGGNLSQGFALLGLFSDDNEAPGASLVECVTAFRDGTVISYNTATHHLQALVQGSAALSAETDVSVSAGGDITAHADGNLTATTGGNITATAEGDLSATAANITATTAGTLTAQANAATVTAATITLTGAVTINGPLALNGPLTAAPGADGGGATITGDVQVSGAVTAAEVTASGISLTGHTHANPEGGTVGAPT